MKSMKFKFDILLDKLKIDKDIFLTENPLNLIYDEGVKAPTEIKISGKVKFKQIMKKDASIKGLDGLTQNFKKAPETDLNDSCNLKRNDILESGQKTK